MQKGYVKTVNLVLQLFQQAADIQIVLLHQQNKQKIIDFSKSLTSKSNPLKKKGKIF